MLFSLAFVILLAEAVVAAPGKILPRSGRTSSPAGCLTVGSSGKYKTVQNAVNALSTTSTTAQCIFIAKGTYKEQVHIPALKSALSIYGETANTSGYSANTVTITQGHGLDSVASDDLTATLRAWTTNLKVYNINLVNTRGKGSQALAVSASATKQGYYGCQFKGFQDTVMAQEGVQVYAKSYIEGATDFIFGQRGQAWFDGVDIRVLTASLGYITANGRDSASNPSYYVINKSSIAAASGNTVASGAYYLGRPWRDYARVVFQSTTMTNIINTAGWSNWAGVNDPRTDHVVFEEYKSSGAGASASRAKFSKQITSTIAISTVLGSDYKSWVDTTYLS